MNQFQLNLKQDRSLSRRMAPLRPLTPLQRIGYLDQVVEIVCRQSFADFVAGQWYRVRTSLVQVIRWDERRNINGAVERIELRGQELAIILADEAGRVWCFMDRRFVSDKVMTSEGVAAQYGFDQLADNFHLPEVPDVAELYPSTYRRMMQRLRSLEAIIRRVRPENKNFTYAAFQLEDIARAGVRDGFVMALDAGLGKCLSMISWALIKTDIRVVDHRIVVQWPILFVTLGDLKQQVAQEALSKFGIECIMLHTLDQLREPVAPGLYIASYEFMAKTDVALTASDKFACVLVDEATKIKESSTSISEAVRLLIPPYRCVATATPIKNRVQDLFWLLHWAAGGKRNAHRAFPFDGSRTGLKKFERLHLLKERNLTREGLKAGAPTVVYKAGTDVCNLHALWPVTAALIVRRRKQDVPECLTRKLETIVWCNLGTEQARIYQAIKDSELSIGQKLMALRQAAVCPAGLEMTPKLMTVLKLILLCVSRKEQVIVFSAFNHMSDLIAKWLRPARIKCVILDGRISQLRRGKLADEFKQGRPLVMLAGEGSMSYGHSFSACQNVIVTSEDWAMDLMAQAPDRAHRIDSKKDVNVYRVLCKGTIEERVNHLHGDKRGAAEMVLDAEVPDEFESELQIDEPSAVETEDEQLLVEEWNKLIL